MKTICIYPGRFQVFSNHHYQAFKKLESIFGRENVFIATSDHVEGEKSPLNFEEKKAVMGMYGLADRVFKVKNTYNASEITDKFNPDDTVVVYAVGEKDMAENPRFKVTPTSYFQMWKKNLKFKPLSKNGYIGIIPNVKSGEEILSGTATRKKLRDAIAQGDEQYKKAFEEIFKKWDPKVGKIIKDKFSQSTPITEGGIASHMSHLFDLPEIQTGSDLINTSYKIIQYLQKNPAAVKIDGVNASIRLVELDGVKQFVMDRGSNKPLDVKGITKADLEDRFGPGHGMIKVGGIVLDIFNDSINIAKGELDKLGLWMDPNILFNLEYVQGKTNVQEYGKNFIAIHGLLRVEQVSPTKRASKEISYDKSTLDSYIQKLGKIAEKYDFTVVGSIPTKMESAPDMSSALNKSYTITYSKSDSKTYTLEQWLDDITVPKDAKVKLKTGETVDAISKKILTLIGSGQPLDKIILDPRDYATAIEGYFTYVGTMVLGKTILDSLDSELGRASEGEGVVIRTNDLNGGKPFKLTGDFILAGQASNFRK